MHSNDPHVLAAMDGNEGEPNKDTGRSEPCAYFFVVFGLAFEVLATVTSDSTSSATNQQSAVTALEATKMLVRPEYSGKALLEPAIFEELISLFYRMAMTSAANVQINLINVVLSLVQNRTDGSLLHESGQMYVMDARVLCMGSHSVASGMELPSRRQAYQRLRL